MKIKPCTRKLLPSVFVITVLLCICSISLAGAYEHKSFSLRLPAALSRFATFGDVAGVGGASAGSKWSTSTNPAALDWLDIKGANHMSVSGQYNKVFFDNGSEMDIWAESYSIDAGEYGTFLLAGIQLSTNKGVMRNDYDFYMTNDGIVAQWAKKITDDWALGFGFNYSKSVVRNNLNDVPIVKSKSDVYGIRLGTLHRLSEKVLGGLVVDYGWSRDRTLYYAIPAWGIMAESHDYDNSQQLLVRPGVSFEYMKDGTAYLDYQFGTFWNKEGTLNVHRVCAGIEQGFFEWVFPRVGVTADPAVGSFSWTCGVGLYPTTWVSVEIAYQYDMFTEIVEEFGRSHTFNISLCFEF